MAEIRKHKPHSTAIGDQVRAAIGGVPRPNQPGPDPAETVDPFYTEEPTAAPGTAATAPGVTAAGQFGGFTLRVSDRSGLVSLGADQLAELAKAGHDVTEDESQDSSAKGEYSPDEDE